MRVSHRTALLTFFSVAILAACGSKDSPTQASAEPTSKGATSSGASSSNASSSGASSSRAEASAPAKTTEPKPSASASASPVAVAPPPSFGFKFKSPRGDYEAVFPKAPDPEKEVEQEVQGLHLKIAALGSTVDDHGVFVSRTDFNIPPSQYDIDKGLKGMIDGGFGQSGCKLEKTTPVKNGAYKGLEGIGQAPQGMGLCSMRAFIVAKKTIVGYGMVVVGSIPVEKATQYFEAFKILE